MGEAIAAQLTTALTNAGNLRVIDYDFFQAQTGNPAKLVNKSAGEVGPFLIRGTVTEFNEVAEAEGSSTGGAFGGLGAALAIGGAIAGNTPATITGSALALANPGYQNTVARRTGSVAMDRVVQPNDGRILGSVMANGLFSSESAASASRLRLRHGEQCLRGERSQAQRAAMNPRLRRSAALETRLQLGFDRAGVRSLAEEVSSR
jgi:hypothetical protein